MNPDTLDTLQLYVTTYRLIKPLTQQGRGNEIQKKLVRDVERAVSRLPKAERQFIETRYLQGSGDIMTTTYCVHCNDLRAEELTKLAAALRLKPQETHREANMCSV